MEEQAVQDLIDESLAETARGRVSAGLVKARRAGDLAARHGYPCREAAALAAQAEAHFRFGHYPEARDLACQAEERILAQETSGSCEMVQDALVVRARACLTIGRCLAETDDLKSAEVYLTRSVELCRSAGDIPLLLSGLHSISAAIYMPCGQYALALSTDAEVLAIARANGLVENLEKPLITMSWVCLLSGQLERSTELLNELRGVVRPMTLADGWADCIEAWLRLRAGDTGAAEAAFQRTRAVGESIGSPELNFFARVGMAAVCRQRGEAANAMDWALDGAALGRRIGYAHIEGIAWLECGRCAWQQENLAAAGDYFSAALEVLTPLQARLELAQSRLGRAAVWLATGHAQAGAAAAEALEFIRATGFTFLIDQERAFAYPVVAAGLRSKNKEFAGLAAELADGFSRVPPPRLRICALGGLRVWQGGQALPARLLRNRRAGELLVLLLTSPNLRLAMESAAEILSPEREMEAALETLHQAVSALRRAMEPDLPARFPSRCIRVENGVLQFLWPWPEPVDTSLDFAAFRQACAREEWETALGLYSGDFLCDSPFSEWCIPLRQQFSLLHQRALLEAARARLAAGDSPGSLDLCRQLHKIEPWHEEAVLLGMRAALAGGDTAAARRLYLSLEKNLRVDLGVAPQAELRSLFSSIARRG